MMASSIASYLTGLLAKVLAGCAGLEPTTKGLEDPCSSIELREHFSYLFVAPARLELALWEPKSHVVASYTIGQ